MRTLFDNSASIENQDEIGVRDGAEPMGDNERRSAL